MKKGEKGGILNMFEKIKTKIQKYSRTIFILLAWILLFGIVALVAVAGLAIFVDGGLWRTHRAIIYVIEFVPALMFVFGNAGGIPKYYKTWSFFLFIFVNFQYYTTISWLGAIHAAFALVIFMISLHVAWGSFKIYLSDRKKNNENSNSNTAMDSHESINENSKINEAS